MRTHDGQRTPHAPDGENHPDSSEAGFTLAEALIAMTLLVALAGFAFSAYALASRAVTRWDQRTDLEDAAHVVRQRLALDLFSADRVRVAAPDSLLVWTAPAGTEADGRASAEPIVFYARDGALYRNDVRAHREAIRLEAFDVWTRTADGDSLLEAGFGEADEITLVGARVRLALDTATVTREVRVALRPTPSWLDR
ncbi:MAG: prepilin-type N-terminal cleavage/methylation domain-containing protein [Bacteroidota bacterium]